MKLLKLCLIIFVCTSPVKAEFNPATYKPTLLPKGELLNLKGKPLWAFSVGEESSKILYLDFLVNSYKEENILLKKSLENYESEKILYEQHVKIVESQRELYANLAKTMQEKAIKFTELYYNEKAKPRLDLGSPIHYFIEVALTGIIVGLVSDKIF